MEFQAEAARVGNSVLHQPQTMLRIFGHESFCYGANRIYHLASSSSQAFQSQEMKGTTLLACNASGL